MKGWTRWEKLHKCCPLTNTLNLWLPQRMEIYGNKGDTIEEKTHANTSCTIAVAVNKEINAAKVNHSRAASSIITHIKVLSLLEGVETELLLFRTPGASNLTVANNYPLFKSGVQVKGDVP